MEKTNYKVRLMMDNAYEVMIIYKDYSEEKVYQGSLADCEAYIRLRENGYM
jgi:hypothetical protein